MTGNRFGGGTGFSSTGDENGFEPLLSKGRAMTHKSQPWPSPHNSNQTASEAELNFIRVNDERYEIPDALVLGG